MTESLGQLWINLGIKSTVGGLSNVKSELAAMNGGCIGVQLGVLGAVTGSLGKIKIHRRDRGGGSWSGRIGGQYTNQ